MSDDYKVQLSLKRGNDMLNIRVETANELRSLADELQKFPELSAFFPRGAETGVAEVAVQEPAETVAATPAPVAPVAVESAPSPQPGLSAIEIARQRMRGGK